MAYLNCIWTDSTYDQQLPQSFPSSKYQKTSTNESRKQKLKSMNEKIKKSNQTEFSSREIRLKNRRYIIPKKLQRNDQFLSIPPPPPSSSSFSIPSETILLEEKPIEFNKKTRENHVTIQDLNDEDRKRIAELINELANVSEQKAKLQNTFQEQLKKVEQEQEVLLSDKVKLQMELEHRQSTISLLKKELATLSHRSEPPTSPPPPPPLSINHPLSTNPFLTSESSSSAFSTTPRKNLTQQDWYLRFHSGEFLPPSSYRKSPDSFHLSSPRHFQPIQLPEDVKATVFSSGLSSSSNQDMQEILLNQQKQLDEISNRLKNILFSGSASPAVATAAAAWPIHHSHFVENTSSAMSCDTVSEQLVPLKALNSQSNSELSLNIPSKEAASQCDTEPFPTSPHASTSHTCETLTSPSIRNDPIRDDVDSLVSGRLVIKSSEPNKYSPRGSLLDIIDSMERRPHEKIIPPSSLSSSSSQFQQLSHQVVSLGKFSPPITRDLDDPMLIDLFFLPNHK